MRQRFVVRMSWPPQGRARSGHARLYLVLADNAMLARGRAEARWRGKQGGADPHITKVLGAVETDLFELHGLPSELR